MSDAVEPEALKLDIEPSYSPDQLAEINHLRYLDERVRLLCDSGAINADARDAILKDGQTRHDSLVRAGRILAGLDLARSLAGTDLEAAVDWANRVRAFDLSSPEPWNVLIDTLWNAGEDDRAIEYCQQASATFPDFGARLAALRDAARERAEHRRLDGDLSFAKQALENGNDVEVLRICEPILALDPEHVDALAYSAFALQRQERLVESLQAYRTLSRLQPELSTWRSWVSNVEQRERQARHAKKPATTHVKDGLGSSDFGTSRATIVVTTEPRLSWRTIAAEFVEDHWQKLILCLAVMLIVVSSTIGAHVLLGPRLWSPVGKCAIALVGTSLFAALGLALTRWGAARAGRFMLITTLIVVPIHFMLAGELRLLTEPSASHLAVAALDVIAIAALCRLVASRVFDPAEATSLTSWLIGISAFNAMATRGDTLPWIAQLVAFEGPAVVFLPAVAWLARRESSAPEEVGSAEAVTGRRDRPFELGLLTFAMLASVLRIGLYAIGIAPAFFSVPVMIAAAAVLGLAEETALEGKPASRLMARLKLIGYTLSALGFALGLQGSSVVTRSDDANLLVTGILGLLLYTALLRRERRPMDLYLAFAALGVSLFAGINFVLGPERPLEVYVGRLLGYPGKPPFPFRAIQIAGLNALLAGLARFFKTRWNDYRLAWHCHAIGLPLSIAACVLSTFEPRAAAIALPLYATLYLIAAQVYRAERLVYLGIAALWGGIAFLDHLINPGTGFRSLAIETTMLGFGCRIMAGHWRWRAIESSEPSPLRSWLKSSLALACLGMVLAVFGLTMEHAFDLHSVAMFLTESALLLWLTWSFPNRIWIHAALGSLLTTWVLSVGSTIGASSLDGPRLGLAVVAFSVLAMFVTRWLRLTDRQSRYRQAIPRFVVATTLGSAVYQGLFWKGGWEESLAFALEAAVLLWITVKIPNPGLVYMSLALFTVAGGDLTVWLAPRGDHGSLLVGWEAITAVILGLIFWAGAWLSRRDPRAALHEAPCLQTGLVMSSCAMDLALYARILSIDAFRLCTAALLINVPLILLLGVAWRSAKLTYFAIASYLTATYVVLLSVGSPNPNNAHVLGLNAVVQGLLLWWLGFGLGKLGDFAARLYTLPLLVSSLWLTVASIPLAYWSPLTMSLAAVSFVLMIKSFPLTGWIYPAVATLGLAVFHAWLAHRTWDAWLVVLILAAYGLWVASLLVDRFKVAICRAFKVPQLGFEFALANSSIIMVLLAAWVRTSWGTPGGLATTDMPWLPLAAAGLCFLWRVPYHSRFFIHSGFGLITWTIISLTAPSLRPTETVGLAVGITALLYAILARLAPLSWIQKISHTSWAPIRELEIARVWSKGLTIAGLAVNSFWIGEAVLATVYPEFFGSGSLPTRTTWYHTFWSTILLGIAAFVVNADRSRGRFLSPDIRLRTVLEVGILWWLGIAGSPLIERGLITSLHYLPLVTAAYSLALMATQAPRWGSLFRAGQGDPKFLEASSAVGPLRERAVFLLALFGALFTRGSVDGFSIGSLLLSAVSLVWLGAASATREVRNLATQAGAITGTVAFALAGPLLTRRMGWDFQEASLLAIAGGIVLAGHLGLMLSELGRRFSLSDSAREDFGPTVLSEWAFLIERTAFLGSLVAAGYLAWASWSSAPHGEAWLVATGIGILIAIASLQGILALRWRSELAVYLAQCALLGAYAVYRRQYPAPVANDALLLTMLAYIDFGIAEAVEGLGVPVFARPMRFVSFILPVLPLLGMVGMNSFADVGMLHMLAAGTFYGVAFASTRWRLFGYAAALAYNAALWAWWSRMGWTLADQPHFYCVPVGLSAILFAEASRDELGKSTVNGIRSVGLLIIYMSTAFPVLRDQSFGAWLALLIFSLVGIFVGIGLRIRTFLWLGLATFLLDIGYQLARFGADHAVARWGIMLGLGIGLFLFVALNEKKQIVQTIREYYERTQAWE